MAISAIATFRAPKAPGLAPALARSPIENPIAFGVRRAVAVLNEFAAFGDDRQVLFGIDARTNTPVVRVIDAKSGEVVDQIPAERVLEISAEVSAQGSAIYA